METLIIINVYVSFILFPIMPVVLTSYLQKIKNDVPCSNEQLFLSAFMFSFWLLILGILFK